MLFNKKDGTEITGIDPKHREFFDSVKARMEKQLDFGDYYSVFGFIDSQIDADLEYPEGNTEHTPGWYDPAGWENVPLQYINKVCGSDPSSATLFYELAVMARIIERTDLWTVDLDLFISGDYENLTYKLMTEKPLSSVWVVTVRTSLPKELEFFDDIKKEFHAFENFVDARDRMRAILRSLSGERNAMFDTDGDIKNLRNYIMDFEESENEDVDFDDHEDEDDGDDDEDFDDEDEECGFSQILSDFHCALKGVFEGKDVKFDIDEYDFDDVYDTSFSSDGKGGVTLFSRSDPNSSDPTLFDSYVSTNAFDMSEEKDYYLYVKDSFKHIGDPCFDEYEESTILFVDLKRVPVE